MVVHNWPAVTMDGTMASEVVREGRPEQLHLNRVSGAEPVLQATVQAQLLRVPEAAVPPVAASSEGAAMGTAAGTGEGDDETAPEGTETCAVCLGEGDDRSGGRGGPWVELPCGHGFHARCILRWSVRQGTCPVCRQAIDGGAVSGEARGGQGLSAGTGVVVSLPLDVTLRVSLWYLSELEFETSWALQTTVLDLFEWLNCLGACRAARSLLVVDFLDEAGQVRSTFKTTESLVFLRRTLSMVTEGSREAAVRVRLGA